MHQRLLMLTALLITSSFFIEMTETLEFIIQPSHGKVVLRQNPSVTFRCRVNQSDSVIIPYWVLRFQELKCEAEPCYWSTDDVSDRPMLDQLKIDYKTDNSATIVTIPVLVKNNLTEIRCAAFNHGQTEFSEAVILSIVERKKSGPGLQSRNSSGTHLAPKEANGSHGTSSANTNLVNLKIVGVVSGCITVALLIAVIAVTVVVIGMRRHKHQMKGSNTAAAVYVAILDTPPVSIKQNNSHCKKHSEKLQQQLDQVDTKPTAVISDQKSS